MAVLDELTPLTLTANLKLGFYKCKQCICALLVLYPGPLNGLLLSTVLVAYVHF